jgi:hypothetical protein
VKHFHQAPAATLVLSLSLLSNFDHGFRRYHKTPLIMTARLGMSQVQRLIAVATTILCSLFLIHIYYSSHPRNGTIPTSQPHFAPGVAKTEYTKTVVMARMSNEDVSWVYKELTEFNYSIYTMDNNSADYYVPQNKGREAMAYVTYIVDHYHDLPDTVLFFHPHKSTWHNNILLDLDSVKTIKRLNPARVQREGYFNARWHLDPGCPDWLRKSQSIQRSAFTLDGNREPPFRLRPMLSSAAADSDLRYRSARI